MSERPVPSVALLRNRMLLTIEFIESVQDFPAGRALKEFIEKEAADDNARTLRLLAREVDAMTNTLEAHERNELHTLLASRLGVDSASEWADAERRVAAALARGRIRSEKERSRLESCLETLVASQADPARIDALRSLLEKD